MARINRLFKPLARTLLSDERVRDKAYRAVMYPGFWNWCRANPCLGQPASAGRGAFYATIDQECRLGGPIDYLEFGVYQGESIRWWAQRNEHAESRFVGFDSFEGLPEDWNKAMPKGHFSTEGRTPQIDDPRVSWQAGWFNETLLPFLEGFQARERLVLHLDADLYSSTLYVLTTMARYLRVDDVLIFDEFSDVVHEYRALVDFCAAFPITFEAVAHHANYTRVALRVRSVG